MFTLLNVYLCALIKKDNIYLYITELIKSYLNLTRCNYFSKKLSFINCFYQFSTLNFLFHIFYVKFSENSILKF